MLPMATYVLIHGAGSDGWYWHRVAPLLRERGHRVLSPDLPVHDESAGLQAYLDVVLDAIGERSDLVVVGQSLGGFTAPLVCAERPAQLLVLLNAMIPAPGETGLNWWANTGHPVDIGPDFDPVRVFLHDVPADVVAQAASHAGEQPDTPMRNPWPLPAWPDVPTRRWSPATTASSPPPGSARWSATGSASRPTRCPAGTASRSADPPNSPSDSKACATVTPGKTRTRCNDDVRSDGGMIPLPIAAPQDRRAGMRRATCVSGPIA